jgi:hypothetical protein
MTVVVTQDSPPLDLRRAPERPDAMIHGAPALWYGLLGPSFFVLLNLELSYALASWACRAGDHVVMPAVTAICFLGDVLAGIAAARHLRRDWLEDTVLTRPPYTAMLGVLLSVLGAVIITAQWLPGLFLSTCQ